MSTHSVPTASMRRVLAAFAAIYIIWGSSYLGIRFAIETIPPFLMAGIRFTTAGVILYALARRGGAQAPTLIHWRSAVLLGALMFLAANGAIVQAERVVPSGIAALLIATLPLWVALLNWLFFRGERPSLQAAIGLFIGLAGIGLLVVPGNFLVGEQINLPGAGLLLFSALCWGTGSLLSRRVPTPASSLSGASLNLITGGLLLVALSGLSGEWNTFALNAVTLKSALALLYLIVFGSVIAFASYMYLLSVVAPTRVATYAYVNPVIAMLLGWLLGEETPSLRTLIGAVVIVTSVVLITTQRPRRTAVEATVSPETPLSTAKM